MITGLDEALSEKQDDLGLTGIADAAAIRGGTDGEKAVVAKAVFDASGFVALTDAATVAVDLSAGFNFTLTLGGNRTLGNPTNLKVGQCGVIEIKQDATGSRTLAFGEDWVFAGGDAPTLTTAANARDLLSYFVLGGGVVFAALMKDVR